MDDGKWCPIGLREDGNAGMCRQVMCAWWIEGGEGDEWSKGCAVRVMAASLRRGLVVELAG